MCSFGYVITDEKFNIIKKEDIFINPNSKFNLIGRKNQTDIELKYNEEFFRKQKEFPNYYETIKELLEDSNTIILGYSTDNDVRYILTELLYYELKPINFKYYDIQTIFDCEYSFGRRISLSDASELLNLKKQDVKHDSLSDAISTMNICMSICAELKTNIADLLKKYQPESFKDYVLTADRDEKIESLTSFSLVKYYMKHETVPIGFVKNKKFCFASKLEKEQLKKSVNLYKILVNGCGEYCEMISDCNIFITADDVDKDDIRYKYALKKQKTGRIIIIKYSDFISKIGVTDETLDKMNPLDNLVKKNKINKWVQKRIMFMKEESESNDSTSLGDVFPEFFKDLKKYNNEGEKNAY